MFGYSSFEIGLLTLVIWFCAFAIVNRICTCVEECTKAKSIAIIQNLKRLEKQNDEK